MSGLLEGKVAVVSGVGPGVGLEVCRAFAREGADLVLGARTEERLREVAAEIEGMGRKAVWRVTNIRDPEDCEALAAAGADALGAPDVLVNNAFRQPPFETVADGSVDAWRKAFEVNVFGTLQMTQAVLRRMDAGSIVFVLSMSMRRVLETYGAYSATKAALLTTVQTLAKEAGPTGIRVNAVVPGYIWGPNVEIYFQMLAAEQGRTPREVYDDVASETALRKLPTSAEVANAIMFLASDLSSGITGQSLDVNAGHWFH